MRNFEIGFVGLSHLGITYSLSAASNGFKVTAYDESVNIIKKLESCINIIEEPLVQNSLKKNIKNKNIYYTTSTSDFKNAN